MYGADKKMGSLPDQFHRRPKLGFSDVNASWAIEAYRCLSTIRRFFGERPKEQRTMYSWEDLLVQYQQVRLFPFEKKLSKILPGSRGRRQFSEDGLARVINKRTRQESEYDSANVTVNYLLHKNSTQFAFS
jgi:hypothetical protein